MSRLNPVLRGWANYFRHGTSSKAFAAINDYAHLRLAIFMGRKHGHSGLGRAGPYGYAWLQTTGIYRLKGTVWS